MRAYLCGPMSHLPQFNIPAFDAAAKHLRAQGISIVSPAELDGPEFRKACLASVDGELPQIEQGGTWGELLARDVKLIADEQIEAIVVLPGWEHSRGANLETFVGRLCGLPVLRYPEMRPIGSTVLREIHGVVCGIKAPNEKFVGGHEWLMDTAESVQANAEAPQSHIEAPVRPSEEVRVTDPRTGGMKGSKQACLGDSDPAAVLELAKVSGFGRKKYARLNYAKGYDWSLSYDALQRHLLAFWNREELDEESKLHHLAHAAWHCLTLLCFVLRQRGTDDRMER